MVGNLFGGERYCEPQEESVIKCEQTGDIATINFGTRSKGSTEEDHNTVTGVIEDGNKKIRYRITGKYIYG